MKGSVGEATPLLVHPSSAGGLDAKKPIRDLIVICLGFFLIFVAFSTTQNLVSSLIPGKLGTVTLALLYVAFCFSSLFISSSATELLTPKWALVAGASTYSLFIAANLNPTAWTLIPAAVTSGVGAGLLWTGQGAYLSNVAANYARAMNQPKKSVLGLFNGIFFASMQACQVVGNVIGVVLLLTGETSSVDGVTEEDEDTTESPDPSGGTDEASPGSPSTALLFYTFLGISISALFVLAALGHQPGEREWARQARQQRREEQQQLQGKQRSAAHYDESDIDVPKHKEITLGDDDDDVGVDLDVDVDVDVEPPLSMRTVLGKVGKVFRLLTDPRMYLLSVSILYLGLQAGFVAADITKSIILPTQGLAGIPMVLICFCVFDGLACFVLGKLSDKLGKMIFIIVGVSVHLSFYAFFLYKCWSSGDHESIKEIDTVVLYIAAGVFGIGDACYNTFSAVILGTFFLDNTEPAFSCRLIFNSLGFVIIFMLGPFVSLFIKMAFLTAVLLLGAFLVVLLHLTVASVNATPSDDDDAENDDLEKKKKQQELTASKQNESRNWRSTRVKPPL
ncbi:UNC93 family protein [Acanthamoeba castellanii str. Neff]|uniref:UNC93 family protein n=1 Tax=Acanthamoeba castellanii (strain ATCC 30010 / Neff) TaxID=1257118 RepID=L8H8N1_ACACF|nr:UNC93 family protein [Acanthamoeba castellanii str. Neff]ELR21073.1 UNC93 family protein [Acanthamoeba castellanii str. Neff]